MLRDDLKIIVSCAAIKVIVQAKTILSKKYPDLGNLSFQVIPSVEIWVRYIGPIFVETENGGRAIADFNFNSWGYADNLDTNKIKSKYGKYVADSKH